VKLLIGGPSQDPWEDRKKRRGVDSRVLYPFPGKVQSRNSCEKTSLRDDGGGNRTHKRKDQKNSPKRVGSTYDLLFIW